MEHEFLKALVLILGVSALTIFILHRFRISSTVGFITAGVLIGPHGTGLISDTAQVEMLAETGVILLLFAIGIEFSLKKLARIKNIVFFSGGGQVLLTIAVTAGSTLWFTHNLRISVFFGFITALSSTAIVLKSLAERGEIDSPHGNLMLGVLIFQDLCVVPMLLITPALGGEDLGFITLFMPLAKAAIIIVITLFSARWLFPRLLHQIVHTRNRELFLISIILACLGVALLTSSLGLSLALGAFLAGLIISESEYAHQATAEILPFKESFLGLFFVSIGMLVDTSYILSNPWLVAGAIAMLMALKVSGALLPLIAFSSSLRASAQAALGLSQIGEFSFILAETGRNAGLMQEDLFQLFLSASVITMAMTPFVLKYAFPISSFMSSLFPSFKPDTGDSREGPGMSDHVIIIGFGLNGRNVAMTLKRAAIPYVVLEMNGITVRKERLKGEPIFFGDATSRYVLDHLGVERARTVVLAISDPAASRKITATVRQLNPDVHIIVRTRYLSEVEDLSGLGADEVVPEEFETSVEIFARVLGHYNVPKNVIGRQIEEIRNDTYSMLRDHAQATPAIGNLCDLSGSITTASYLIMESSAALGKSILDLKIRNLTGATVIAIKRDNALMQNPPPDEKILLDDIVILIGQREQLSSAIRLLEGASG